jgi:hypothetical protein
MGGNPDHDRKSRIFNNLGCIPGTNDGYLPHMATSRACYGGPRAIVFLVEGGGAMLATRPVNSIFRKTRANFDARPVAARLKTLQERFP